MNPEEMQLLQKAYEVQGDLFQDMICRGDGFEMTESLPDNLEYFELKSCHFSIADDEGTIGQFDDETKTLSIGKEYTEDERVWLHELIHLYEHNLESVPGGMVFRDAVIWHLYCKLRDSSDGVPLLLLLCRQSCFITEVSEHRRHGTRSAGGFLDALYRVGHHGVNAGEGILRRFREDSVKQVICKVCAGRGVRKQLLAHRRHESTCIVLKRSRGIGELIFRALVVSLHNGGILHQIIVSGEKPFRV